MKKLFFSLIMAMAMCIAANCQAQVLASHLRLDPGVTNLTAGINTNVAYFRYKYGGKDVDPLLIINQSISQSSDKQRATTYGFGLNVQLFREGYEFDKAWTTVVSNDSVKIQMLKSVPRADRLIGANVSPVFRITDDRKAPCKFSTVWVLGGNLPIPRSWFVQAEINVGLVHTLNFPIDGKQIKIIGSVDQLPICLTVKGPPDWPKIGLKVEHDLRFGHVSGGLAYSFGP
jgi:hypothetical protein